MTDKAKLLVLELWGLGDLAIASQFISKASLTHEVTVLAKPYAKDLRDLLWPHAEVITFHAPWTAFHGKYQLARWPWRSMRQLLKQLRDHHFDIAVSGRWDPRDHALMWMTRAKRRVGFKRRGSQCLLTDPIFMHPDQSHRFNQWVAIGKTIGINLDPYEPKVHQGKQLPKPRLLRCVVHTGAAQAVRQWPLDRFQTLIKWLEERSVEVDILCDPEQQPLWASHGRNARVCQSVSELAQVLRGAEAFIGNDSGPGHLAAAMNVATLTVFGPQRTDWFRPAHPKGEVIEGGDCPYKPCFDACRFDVPHCLDAVTSASAVEKLDGFVKAHFELP
jgi:ADP-heptose:LPS heptosyltransferase